MTKGLAWTQRLLDTLSGWAVERRATIFILSLAIAGVFGWQLRYLEVDTSPEALVTAIEGHDEASSLFQEHFERAESQVLVILRAPDVTTSELLRYQYQLHRRLAALEASAQVDGVTHLTLPTSLGKPPSREELMALQVARQNDARGQAAPTDAASASSAPASGQRHSSSPLLKQEVLEEIVKGDPQLFESGLEGLGMRLAQAEPAPSLRGDDPSAVEVERYREALLRADWLRPSLLSKDSTATVMVVHFDPDRVVDQASKLAALTAIRSVARALPRPEGVEVLYGGAPVMREVILEKLARDRDVLNPAMGIVCLLVLMITFRWWAAVVAPLAAVGIAAVFVIGSMAVVGQPLTILTNIIPPLLIIVGLSDSVHLLGRYQEEIRMNPQRVGAGRAAARAMLVACFLTSLTTAVGFASLATAQTPELRTFGIVAAAGVLAAYVATVFFVPAFVTLVPFPRSWRPDPAKTTRGRHRPGLIERWVFSVTHLVLRRPRAMAVLTVVGAVGFGGIALQVSVDDRLLDIFEKEEETTKITHLVEEKLSGIRPLEVLLTREEGSFFEPKLLSHIEETLAWARRDPDIITVNSYVEPLREARVNLTGEQSARTLPFASEAHAHALWVAARTNSRDGAMRWVTDDGRAARLTIFFKDAGVTRSLELIDEIEGRLQAGISPEMGVRLSFLGEAYTGSVGRSHILSDLMSGLGLALAIIFVLLVVLFRSLRVGLIAMPPNIVPLLATAAYMTLRGIPLNLTTVITFSIGIGLAVDDTVHVVTRFREERARLTSLRVGLLRAARGTGQAIVVTAFSLVLGFLVLTQSEFVSVRQFGELIAVTVLNCLLGALLIQPALLYLVYRSSARGRRRTLTRP